MSTDITILGVCGGPRKNGVTIKATQHFLDTAASIPGVRVELIDLAGKNILPCIGCNACRKNKTHHCEVLHDDFDPAWIDMYINCDAIVLASPIYMMNPTGVLTNFMSRLRPATVYSSKGKYAIRHGTSIAVGGHRNGGQDAVVNSLNNLLQNYGTNIIGGAVLFYNGPTVWANNDREFDDPYGRQEVEVAARKLVYLTKATLTGIQAMQEEIPMVRYCGFDSLEDMREGFRKIGM